MNTVITVVPTDLTEALAPTALAPVPGRMPAGDFDLLIALLQAALASPAMPGAGAPVVASGTAVPAAPAAAGASTATGAGVTNATDGVAADPTVPALTVETSTAPSLTATQPRRAPRAASADEAALTAVDAVEPREPDADEDGHPPLIPGAPESLVLTLAPAPAPGPGPTPGPAPGPAPAPTPGISPSRAPAVSTTAPAITTASDERAADLAPAIAPPVTPAALRPTDLPAEAPPQTNGAAPPGARPAVLAEAVIRPLVAESRAIPPPKTPALASSEATAEAEALGAPVGAPVDESRPRPAPATRRGEPVRIGESTPIPDRVADLVVQRLTAVMTTREARGDGSRDDVSRFSPRPLRDDGATVGPAWESAVAGASAPTASPTARAALEDIESVRPAPLRDPVDQVATRLREVRTDGRHEISLRLDPPDLGAVRIEVRLEGVRLHLQIRAEHAPTGELLADALPRLRDALVQQGFVPAEVNVHLGLDASGRHFGRDGAPTFTPRPDGETISPPRVVPAATLHPVVASDGLDVWA